MQKGRKALNLTAVLIISLIFSLVVPSFSFYAYAATDGVLVADNSISYFGNLYMVPGQTLTQRVSFNFSCNNANSGAIGGVFDFTLKFPPPQQYISFNILDAYVVIGSERHEVAFDIMETAADGSFKYQFWSRFVTKNISVYSYARLVVEIQLACGAEAKATVDDDRTQRFAGAGESAYSITFDPSGHATTETNYARLFIKHKFLGGDDDYFNGVTTSKTNFSGVKLNVPYRVTPDHYITSTGDMYVRTDNIYLPHLKVDLLKYSGSLNVGSVDYQVDDDRTHELLEQLIREGGTNADTGTHNRLDSMLQQQQQQAQAQLDESQKQTDALTSFDGKGTMDSSKTELDSTMGSYDEAERNLFETAGAAIGAIDMATSLKPSAGVLSGIQHLSGIILGIIGAMGEFSILYTAGYVIVLILILFGLFKYTTSSTKEE